MSRRKARRRSPSQAAIGVTPTAAVSTLAAPADPKGQPAGPAMPRQVVGARNRARAERAEAAGRRSGNTTHADWLARTRAADDPQAGEADDLKTIQAELEGMGGLIGSRPRQTLPVNANVLGQLPYYWLPRRQYNQVDLTSLSNVSMTSQQIIDLLVDAWPEMGLAVWNFVRLAIGDYTYQVRTPDNQYEDAEGKALLDGILARVNQPWGGVRSLLWQFAQSVVIQGACAGETIPTSTIDGVHDLVAVQPWTIYFQRNMDQEYVPFQWQPLMALVGQGGLGASSAALAAQGYGSASPTLASASSLASSGSTYGQPPDASKMILRKAVDLGFRELNTHTFAYVPLDTEVDDPYGRMPLAPALQMVAFDAQLLKDLRQWAHSNAWGRMDIKVLADQVKDLAPPAVRADPAKMARWLNRYLSDIQKAFGNLYPDDHLVHWDNVEVTGVSVAGQSMEIDNLVRLVERKVFRALKTLPILMGSNEGTTETWGTLQMEVYARGVAAIQQTVASLMEKLLTVALRLHGRASIVQWEFAQLRSTDRIKDAMAEKAEIQNAAAKRDQGWITQDEASVLITGSAAVADAPDPDDMAAPNMPDASEEHQPAGEAGKGDQGEAAQGETVTPPGTDGDPNTAGSGKGDDNPPTPGGKNNPSGEGEPDRPSDADSDQADQDAEDAVDEANAKQSSGASQGSTDGADDGQDETAKDPSKKAANPKRAAHPMARVGVTFTEDQATAIRAADLATRAATSTADDPQATSAGHTGVMIAFLLAPDECAALSEAIPDGEGAWPEGALAYPSDYHVTLTYHGDLGDGATTGEDVAALRGALAQWAADYDGGALSGTTSGVARFTNDQSAPEAVVALVNCPGLLELRASLMAACAGPAVPDGLKPSEAFSYTPHVTLAYLSPNEPSPMDRLPPIPLVLSRVTLAAGDAHYSYVLGGGEGGGPGTPAPFDSARATASATEATRAGEGKGGGKGTPKPMYGYRGHSDKRLALKRSLAKKAAAYFDSHRLSRAAVKRVVDKHQSARYGLSYTFSDPALAQAVETIRTNRATRLAADLGLVRDSNPQPLTKDQLDALIASILFDLADEIPADDPDLIALLYEGGLEASNLGGAEALANLGLSGAFDLSNSAMLDRLSNYVASRAADLAGTSSDLVAAAIADGLSSGDDLGGIYDAVGGLYDAWGGARADLIGGYETDHAYWSTTITTFQFNGVSYKVWATGGDPDPGSKGYAPCQDNSYAGAIPIGDTFPSGDDEPPAHGNCICEVLPAGDPNDLASGEDIWTGGDDPALGE